MVNTKMEKMSVCGIGWAMRSAGMTDEEISGMSGNIRCGLKTIFNHKSTNKSIERIWI